MNPEAPFPEFKPFGKISRLIREVVVSEKIDGTNGCVYVGEDGQVIAGSRTRWIVPGDDNFGFALWVQQHEEELRAGLGPGLHFGEWWGVGIQRNYGLHERRFSLFNVSKWGDDAVRPKCCHVVPVLYTGPFDTAQIQQVVDQLGLIGSRAVPGFMKPEGVVIYHKASGQLFKKTIEKDAEPKGRAG